MELRWMCCLVAMLALAGAGELTEEQYYSMPALFELDGLRACVSRRALYCLGSFQLLPGHNPHLLRSVQEFSADKYHFNHTRIHRGYCVTSRCVYTQHMHGATHRARFQTCVSNITRREYGLDARLTQLQYCRSAQGSARPVDPLEWGFAASCLALLLANLAGTGYDLLRDKNAKPNQYLVAWSARENWSRLTAQHTADARLTALKPLQGMKVLTLMLIMLAHSVLAYHLTYIQNPLFLETASHHVLVAYFQNGTSIVHTFLMASSFLLGYNMLLHSDARPLSARLLPRALLHRLTRIWPLYAWVVCAASTWWARAGDGPLWPPLVAAESARCRMSMTTFDDLLKRVNEDLNKRDTNMRNSITPEEKLAICLRDKWWTHLVFVNNLVRPDDKCLIHTWFLAVDSQLYALSAVVMICLSQQPRRALAALAGLLALAVLGNALAAYYYDLRPMVTLMFPENMRVQFAGEASFTWLYAAPWDGAPAALLGLAAARIHFQLQGQPRLRASRVFRGVYRASVPLMFSWVVAGYWMKGVTSRTALAAYAALDRPVFIALTTTAMLGFFHQVDMLWWRMVSWRGWQVLGRLSLPAYLAHWPLALTALALRDHASPASVHEIGGHFLWTVFVSYWAALPLHLFIELPMQKFLQNLFS